MNVRIAPPQRPTAGPDVALECEHAIEAAMGELVDRVITAGWPPEAAFAAVKRVAERQAHAYQEDPDPAEDPAAARPPTGFSLAPF